MSQSPLLSVIDPEPPHSQRIAKPKDRTRETAEIEPSDSLEFQGFPELSLQSISQAKFLRLGNSAQDFLGVNFCWKPQDFFWVLIFDPIRPSRSFEIRSIHPLESQRQPNRFKTTLRNTKKNVISLFHLYPTIS